MGGEDAGAAVLEEFVEALAADPGLGEDVGHGGRLVAALGGDLDGRLQQPLALGALDRLAREPVAAARQRRRRRRPLRRVTPRPRPARPRPARLAQRLVVPGERRDREVDDVRGPAPAAAPGARRRPRGRPAAGRGRRRARGSGACAAAPRPASQIASSAGTVKRAVALDQPRVDPDHVAAQDLGQLRLGGEQVERRDRRRAGSPRRASRSRRPRPPRSPRSGRCSA